MSKHTKNKIIHIYSTLEQQEFEQIFLQYHPILLHYGVSIVRDDALVEDCIQELFVHLYEKKIVLKDIQNLKAYLFTALRRRILEKIKKNSTIHLTINQTDIQYSQELFLISQEINEEKLALLNTYLNQLPSRQKEAIYLKFFNNLSAKEIADIMGITTQVVTNTVYKALKKLREMNAIGILPLLSQLCFLL